MKPFSVVVLAGMLLVLAFAAPAQLVIHEIHADPPDKLEPVEFVELVNTNAAPVSLAGWRLRGGVEFIFPATNLPAGGYVVVAQNPAALKAKFGADALGPWTGRLDAKGEEVELLDATGDPVDRVDYGLGFPWPTVGEPPGFSIELLNPALDNDLGGNWRRSLAGGDAGSTVTLLSLGSTWSYLKGTQEASSPATAWRAAGFNDAAWPSGPLPIGYDPTLPLATRLNDMSGSYTTVFLRRTFEVADPNQFDMLELHALYDDGFKLWINGTRVVNANVAAGELPFSGTAGPARESNDFETFTAGNARALLRTGRNVVAVQLFNSVLSGSSDCFFDLRLVGRSGPTGAGPSPGRANVVFVTNAPPALRQVIHSPEQPRAGQPVRVTAKVTDPEGVTTVQLLYQIVNPGAYLELTDAAYATNWTIMPMNDSGRGGDAVAGDDIFTAELPAALQAHRRLVRYRLAATDARGAAVQVPYADDPQPNFAYFVYDGVPAWTGAVRPGVAGTPGQSFTVAAEEMNRLPVIHLLGKKATVEQSTWLARYGGDAYPYAGTLVYDGKVYDHIRHRARGGVWRYAMTKNMWKFDLNRGHDFEARDNWGRRFKTGWTKLNLGASIQQGDFNHRGEQGLFESLGLRFFQLAGVAAPHTAYVQFRVVDEAAEVSPASQYEGDFWGVYLLVEQENGRFLEEHGLPDGNLYKMEGGSGELNNLGPAGPADKGDLNAFLGAYTSANESWWRTNLNLASYLGYQTVVQAIHHYDICYDKNFFYYLNPETRLWQVVPWDLDLTWAENMFDAGCGGVDRIKERLIPNATRFPAVWREWQNTIRGFRDLLWNEDEGARLIDEHAGRLRGPAGRPSLLDADRAQWDYNPKMVSGTYSTNPDSKAGHGRFYQWPNYSAGVAPRTFDGAVAIMKRYIGFRATNSAAQARSLDAIAADAAIPARPALAYSGPTNFPVHSLRFRTSAYSGSTPFAAQRWRVGEIAKPAAPSWQSAEPWKYEIEAMWESGALTNFTDELAVPAGVLRPGRVYRARVQVQDAQGRTSRWSAPVEFTAGEPDNAALLAAHLRVTELMYDPADGAGLEFIELQNMSDASGLDLAGVRFTQGIEFTFPAGAALGPGQFGVVIRTNAAAFRARYSLAGDVPVFGPYGGNLNNDGERVVLRTAAGGTDLADFEYHDGRGWPLAAAGAGHSLVPRPDGLLDPAGGSLDWGGNWRASAYLGGSPGAADPGAPVTLLLNEVTSHTDFASAFDSNDWIEFHNPGGGDFIFGPGWFLSDRPEDLRSWQIPPGTIVPARGYVVFDEQTGFHNPTNTGFGLNKAGDRVFLSHLPGGGADRVVDAGRVPGQENGWSWGRTPSGGPWAQHAPRTRGTANGLLPGGVQLTEVMYQPTNDAPALEFIEIFQPAPQGAWQGPPLRPTTNGVWRVAGAVEFSFPPQFAAGQGYLVLVGFNPADAAALAAFRAAYGFTNLSVPVLGPWTGRLGNRSGRLTLEYPIAPDVPGGPVTWVPVDEFNYGIRAPWERADDNDRSLQRVQPAAPSELPASWAAATPTPGRGRDAGGDTDYDGMPDTWEATYDLNPFDAADAHLDSDGDGLVNRDEYRAGTGPRDATSVLRILAASLDGGTVTLRVQAVAGRGYAVERAAEPGGPWEWAQAFPGGPADGPVEVTVPLPPAGEGYFRVRPL
ncbi:MAG: lamin tail domain-containing protein [Limisphaerales bacterium]